MVPPDSHGISGVPCYLGLRSTVSNLRLQGCYLLCQCLSRALRLHLTFLTVRPIDSSVRAAPQHPKCNACQLSHILGLASSAFARHYLRNHGCFLFLWVLRCFTSPRSLQPPYVFRRRSPDITPVSFEVSLFGDPRIEARLPAPRGLSQVTTSFIGSWCLGIHRLPLVACCYYKDARVHCEVLNIRAVTRADFNV